MPPEDDTEETKEATEEKSVTPPADPPKDPPAPAPVQAKTVVLPQSALGRIKKEEREKGKKDAKLEMAKQYGFSTAEEFDAWARQQKAQPAPTAQAPVRANPPPGTTPQDPGPAPAGLSPKAQAAWNRERQKIQQERDTARRQASHFEKKYRQERKTREDRETEMVLRETAISCGVNDPGYAVHLLTKFVEDKTEEQLKGFDEKKFFLGLRETNPALFSEIVKPATTGTTQPGGAPSAPKPGDATQQVAANGKVDAMKMDQKAYQEYLRKRGLNPSL